MTKNIPSLLLDHTKDKKVIENSSFDESSSSDYYERAGDWFEPEGLSIEEQFKGIPELSATSKELFKAPNGQ